VYHQRRFFIAGLLAAIIALPLLFLVLLQGLQQVAQVAAKRRLEEESLQTITLLKSELHWVKKGKELRLHGKLFDVKNLQERGTTITVTGFYDEAETGIANLLAQNTNQRGQNTWLVSLLGALRYFGRFSLFAFVFSFTQSVPSYSLFQKIAYKNPFLPVLSPPPLFGAF